MVVKTVYAILLIFVVLVVIVPLVLNTLGIPVSPGGGGGKILGTARSGILFRSGDGAQNWQTAEFNHDNKAVLPSEILDIAFYPVDTNILFAGTASSGLWKSEDGGVVWKKVVDRDAVLQPRADVYAISISKLKPAVMYLGVVQNARGQVLRSDDAGASWREIYTVTKDKWGVFGVYTQPGAPNNIMIATGEGRLLVSDDGGKTLRLARSFTAPLFVLAVNPLFPDERYAITSLGTIAKTFNAGAEWIDLESPSNTPNGTRTGEIAHPYANWQLTFSSTAPSFSFAIDPQNPSTLYFTRNDALFTSSDGGFTWRKMTTLIASQGTALGGVTAHPVREGTIFVTAGADLYQSADRGASWSVKTIAGASSLKKIFIDPRHPEIIFITTAR